MNDDIARLGESKYLLVTTFRADGTPKPTPVWVAHDGTDLLVWTVTDSWKVKRIRRNPAVEVAPCTVRGEPLGASVPGTARVLDADGSERARRAVARKYGVVGRVTVFVSRLRRGRDGTIGIAITPSTTG
ncbi:PPOX class F420-dependent oxidoreductase [Umezawaea beigongshangensis]|uniref:PPOX class F420-dependent oxidoreductase n=1 Tax=Umezawaea beigongshangensis TaxID=2780383 RepID=UPI0018F21F8B|nr:PPOX class F420-dependent oxidoreductase [Umezawaea beigongshangensis]